MDALGSAQRAAIDKGVEMTAGGTPVRYLRSTFVPGDVRCMCLFEADSAAAVEKLNQDAGIPFDQVTEALDLAP